MTAGHVGTMSSLIAAPWYPGRQQDRPRDRQQGQPRVLQESKGTSLGWGPARKPNQEGRVNSAPAGSRLIYGVIQARTKAVNPGLNLLGKDYSHTTRTFHIFLTQFSSIQSHPELNSHTAAELSLSMSTESRMVGKGVIRGCRSFCAFSTLRNPDKRIPPYSATQVFSRCLLGRGGSWMATEGCILQLESHNIFTKIFTKIKLILCHPALVLPLILA